MKTISEPPSAITITRGSNDYLIPTSVNDDIAPLGKRTTTYYIQGGPEKRGHKLLAIIPSNLNWFTIFFHWKKRVRDVVGVNIVVGVEIRIGTGIEQNWAPISCFCTTLLNWKHLHFLLQCSVLLCKETCKKTSKSSHLICTQSAFTIERHVMVGDFFGQYGTRSSAIAVGPRDASCQLKSCQLPHNNAETTCTTSPEPSISCR